MNPLKAEMAAYLSEFVTEKRLNLFKNVVSKRTRFISVVLEDVLNPHDACAVMRSCECFGIQDLHIISQRTPFRLSRGVAVGASKWVSTISHRKPSENNTAECLGDLKDQGYRIALVTSKGEPVQNVSLEQKTAVVFGSEDLGLSDEAYKYADTLISLPAVGFTQTFNISVCAALCLSSLRTRLEASSLSWQLDDEDRADLMLEWLAKMPRKIKSLTARFLVDRGLKVEALEEAGFKREVLSLLL